MCIRIKSWSAKHLFFAGRLTLVSSVLMALQNYWAQIMILPKSIFKVVNGICRSFLWKGTTDSSVPGKVAWNTVCKSKKEGGLGLTNLRMWNIATMGKHDYSPKSDDSWYWRAICQIKDLMKQHITENQLMAISKYSIKKAYLKLMGPAPVQYRTTAVWGRLGQPKHRFIIWLALLGRLNTKDRLMKICVTTDNTCLLCGIAIEDHKHLFSGCPFSERCWHQIGLWLGIRCTRNLPELVNWLHKRSVTKFRKEVIYAVVMCTVYHIWKERNNALWNGQVCKVDKWASPLEKLGCKVAC
ncbi:uncharacterized protein [Spinacia oleracea]|uniref:Reverse transcriptase zinc-binding domain-containing protein n=1 Tax=Spinacia oleracea TaxID=3562 RepID=A0ABM3QW98_SPIOL|nr:uncharacterized protein LOC110791776 [Spinacia oleracea]